MTDFVGYKQEFLSLFGFGVAGVDYELEVETEVAINHLIEGSVIG